MTRDQLSDRIKFTLGLQDDTTFSETTYITDLIYEAIIDISVKTAPYVRTLNLTTTAGVAVHDLLPSVMKILQVRDDVGTLAPFAREDVEAMQVNGSRGYAYREPQLTVSPIPSGGQLHVTGILRPTKMTVGTQAPSDPAYGGLAEEFHPAIITYCLWKGGEYVQHEASGNGEKWRIQYKGQDGHSGELGEIRRMLNKRIVGGARRRQPLRTTGYVPDLGYWTGG